eukprot:3069730-Amphidinium_carterae.1
MMLAPSEVQWPSRQGTISALKGVRATSFHSFNRFTAMNPILSGYGFEKEGKLAGACNCDMRVFTLSRRLAERTYATTGVKDEIMENKCNVANEEL